ncbi:MAG: glycoside hydrolase family 92 protein [Bacteroidales bacterium]|nr:MAG: glycoside hydrolase family 92 protein [Bacteroidales bacterium]
MNKTLLILALTISLSCTKQYKDFEPIDYVKPNIGSVHGRWFFYTPAAIPFGMAKLAPHTNAYGSLGSWTPCGYDDSHSSIEGFGHFHEFQVGGVVVMPTTGVLQTVPGTLENPDKGYRSRFDKGDEHAEAGYYSVFLNDYKIKAEITATARVGYHRYTFPASEQSHLIFDVGHRQGESSGVTEAMVQLVDKNRVEGYVITYPEYAKFCDPGNKVKMYFHAQLSKEPESIGTFVDSTITPNEKISKGVWNGLYLTFKTTENEVVEMQVGLSYTSIENAKRNLEVESKGVSFDQVRGNAKEIWNEKLGRVMVYGGKEADRTKFYTGLYHALLGRGLSNDANGQYPLNSGGIGQIPLDDKGNTKHNHYNTDGMWGGCWNLVQVWALAYPEYFSNYMQSNIDFYSETGWLHDGEAAGVYTNGVQTNFMGLIMASAYNCGIRDFDIKKGYEAAYKNETNYENRNLGNGRYDNEFFVKQGYIPLKEYIVPNGWTFNFGSSHTLEYCFGSYAVAQMAKSLGKENDYQLLMKQAGGYKLIFDSETKFIRPRELDGSFLMDFDPMKAWLGFQEGNAYQFTWYVPHDIYGLIDLLGKGLFNERLEMTFNESRKSGFGGGKSTDSFSGVEMLYNHGNQPCLHQSWLFNYSGKPWLTQKWTRTICDEFYGTEPLHGYGYGQDEDQGQMGAWYVLASMGLFDVQGHAAQRPSFQLGSPLFDHIEINLNKKYYEGKKFRIDVKNGNEKNIYIQSAKLNGEKLDNCWFYRDELMKGGRLELVMGAEPNMQWGVGQVPPSMSNEIER